MSKNRNRAKLNKANTGREYHQIGMNEVYPMYWDEGIMFYPRYRRGFRNPNKVLQRYKQRAYRSWKHNRKTKWKEK
jgi:hypothetical protein